MRSKRGRRISLPLAFLFLLAACGRAPLQDPVASPDAPNPAFAIALSVLGDAVYLVDPVTGARRTIEQALDDFQAGHATWAPDHRTLAYGNGGIVILNAESNSKRVLVRGSSLSMPAWSPEGERVVYGDALSLSISPVVAVEARSLEVPPTLAPVGMAWRPGPSIVFEGLELDCSGGSCESTDLSEIWRINPNGSGLQQLTRVGHAAGPKWSPDGAQVLFIRTLGPAQDPGSRELWVVRSDGTGARQALPLFDVLAADWSPDGSRIVLVRSGQEPGTLQVWVVGSNGTGLHPIGPPVPGNQVTVDW